MTVMRDALYNMNPDSGADPNYARGVLVGAIAAVMEFEACTFNEAIVMLSPHVPDKIDPLVIPSGWDQLFRKEK